MDSLWLCGVRTYPEFGNMTDAFAGTLEEIYKKWSKDKPVPIRCPCFTASTSPDVVVSHDVYGEYGHGRTGPRGTRRAGAITYAATPKNTRHQQAI
jgi:hypothetical protein